MTSHVDSIGGSSYDAKIVKTEIEQEDDDDENYNTMALMELATCVETNVEPMEFNSTEAMLNPKTGLMVCLHCLEEMAMNLLHEHMVNAHNYRRVKLKCHICGNTFSDMKLLDIHKKECRKTPEKRTKRRSFVQFMKDAGVPTEALTSANGVTCPKCSRNFKSKLTLREHIKLVHEALMNSEECDLCGQKFSSQKYLSNHKRNVHPTGNKIHKCHVCDKVFKSRLCLHQHTKYVHPPPSASVTCPHCPKKTFKSKLNLHQHLKVTHGWRNNKQDSK